MIRGVSRASLDTLRAEVEQGISDRSSTDRSALSEQLSAVGVLLTAQPRLRRTLADPSMSPEARATLATTLLQDKIGSSAMAVVRTAVRQRWSSPWDLVDALERAADDVLLAAAEEPGHSERSRTSCSASSGSSRLNPELTTLLDRPHSRLIDASNCCARWSPARSLRSRCCCSSTRSAAAVGTVSPRPLAGCSRRPRPGETDRSRASSRPCR